MPALNDHQLARFTPKVNRTSGAGCWEWTAARTAGGYGNFALVSKRGEYVFRVAHRLAFEHWRGPIPEGMQLDHLCRNRACVNPWHLEPVTNRENTLRGLKSGLMATCANGHTWTDETTYVRPNGRRRCHICQTAANRRTAERRRLAKGAA